MFGIGLPEMIVIFAVALIVVGPDKLPGLARSLAKGVMEMKKTLEQVKENLNQESEVLNSVQTDLEKTAEELRKKMIDTVPADEHLIVNGTYEEKQDLPAEGTSLNNGDPTSLKPNTSLHPAETHFKENLHAGPPEDKHV